MQWQNILQTIKGHYLFFIVILLLLIFVVNHISDGRKKSKKRDEYEARIHQLEQENITIWKVMQTTLMLNDSLEHEFIELKNTNDKTKQNINSLKYENNVLLRQMYYSPDAYADSFYLLTVIPTLKQRYFGVITNP